MATPKKKRDLKYSPHLITYIDILGFRELVKEKPPNFISRAIRRVMETTAPDKRIRKVNEENYIKFSDLIIHTVPILSAANKKFREGIVFLEIQSLALAQAALVEEGLLLRGALTIGMLERSYGVLFGPGIISAYDLERAEAQFPRIVVDSELIGALKLNPLLRSHEYKQEMEFVSKYIKRDDDGVIFIDYLGGVQDEAGEDYLGFLRTHKRLVEGNMVNFKHNKRVLSKYLWLMKYHNAVVQAHCTTELHEELAVIGPEAASDVPLLLSRPLRQPDEESH